MTNIVSLAVSIVSCLVTNVDTTETKSGGIVSEKTEVEVISQQIFEITPKHTLPAKEPIVVPELHRLIQQKEISRTARTYKLANQWQLKETKTIQPSKDIPPWQRRRLGK